jgi:adenosine deaminase
MSSELKLITALGNEPDLILQFIDFFNGGQRFIYNTEANAIRNHFRGKKLSSIHLICTREEKVQVAFNELLEKVPAEYPELAGHIKEIPLLCDDISCHKDDHVMRRAVYDQVKALAAENLIIASGGRKTVTNRLIEAGLLFGCMGYLTLTAPYNQQKRTFSEFFNLIWTPTRQFAEERQRSSYKGELGDNFRSLYLLPLTIIDRLRTEKLGLDPARTEEERAWLQSLPKADLHCHLGGAFDPGLLKKLATVLLDDLPVPYPERRKIRDQLEQLLDCSLADLQPDHLMALAGENASHCLVGMKGLVAKVGVPQHVLTAVMVDALTVEQIEQLAWNEPAPHSNSNRLDWYMACGDLGGSALLQSKNTLRRALRWLMEQSLSENVQFLEVRFSPDNCTRAGLSISEVVETLLDEAHSFVSNHPHRFKVNFLIMATRHKEKAAMAAHVAAAVTFGRPGGGSGPGITGFDLAGQEEDNDPLQFQELFMPLHHHFMNITIHAGEMSSEDKIWQALYLFHARRIGHGLKLVKNPKMMGYIRDHGITIEMCPSSNRQTNLFRLNDETADKGDEYPLKKYLDFGLAVTVNTDNRGISRTTMSRELLQAAKLSPQGLSRWEILRLIKNSFKAAFLPKDEKDRLLKEVDRQIFSLILDDYFRGTADGPG